MLMTYQLVDAPDSGPSRNPDTVVPPIPLHTSLDLLCCCWNWISCFGFVCCTDCVSNNYNIYNVFTIVCLFFFSCCRMFVVCHIRLLAYSLVDLQINIHMWISRIELNPLTKLCHDGFFAKCIIPRTYFSELVLGFLANIHKCSIKLFRRVWRLIIIFKNVEKISINSIDSL